MYKTLMICASFLIYPSYTSISRDGLNVMINFLSRVVGSQDGENKGEEGMGTWASHG